MTPAQISNGAEARKWRERLGLTVDQVADAADIAPHEVHTAEGDWHGQPERVTAITAALTAEYQRQAREALKNDTPLTWAKRFRPDLYKAYRAQPGDDVSAILATIREAAGEPEPAPALVEPVRERRCVVVHEEPVAPEGLRVEHFPNGTTEVGSIGRVSSDGTIWMSGGQVLAYGVRYLADLSDYRRAKAAQDDAQRKLAAVEEAQRAYRKASSDYSSAQFRYDEAARALNAAKREAGL